MDDVHVTEGGMILKDDVHIGDIQTSTINGGDTLQISKMDIEPGYQGNGYATEALEQFIEHARHAGYDALETNHVTHYRMDYALLSAGFGYVEDHPDEVYRIEL